MKKLLSLMSVFALAAGAATSAGFLSTTANNQPTNVVTLGKNLSNLGVSTQEANEVEPGHWRGTKEEADAKLTETRTMIETWYPEAKEDVDYTVTKVGENGSWTLNPIKGGLMDFDGYIFDVIIDLSVLNAENLTIGIDDTDATESEIQTRVANLISTIAIGTEIGDDYNIPFKFDGDGKLDKVGIYQIEANENSDNLSGSFDVKVIKDLNVDHVGDNTSGSKAEGNKILNKIINDFKEWNPKAVEGTDYVVTPKANGSWEIKSSEESLVKVDLEFNVVKDISVIKEITFYINKGDATRGTIEAGVQAAIDKIAEGAVLGTDYTIADIQYDAEGPDGRPTRAGRYLVTAKEGSKLLKGQFNIRLVVKF